MEAIFDFRMFRRDIIHYGRRFVP